MKIIAEVFKLEGGSLILQLYGLRDDGSVERAATDTLLDLISESRSEELQVLDSLLAQAESGHYQPVNADLPDWSSNDKNVWLMSPRAPLGTLIVSNENIPELAADGGQPQLFPIPSVRKAIRHWLQFQLRIAATGASNLLDQRFETNI